MKSLKESIFKESIFKESIFKDVEDIVNDDTTIIEQFLKDNYEINGAYTVKDGVVDVNGGVEVKNKNIESLTRGIFRFRNVTGKFSCAQCHNLTSLKGAPEEVGGVFDCELCRNLISLEGGPKKVGGGFYCKKCEKLTSLKGAPEKIKGGFSCLDCKNLKITDSDRKKYKIKY